MPTIEVRGKKRISAVHLRDLLVDIGPALMVVVEDVQGVQGSGATSAFSFGRGCGVIEGVLAGLDRPVTYVTPQRWTKDLGVGADKGAHRLMAQRLWPFDADLFGRVKDDGRADAALLAHWWMRGLG
jgi:crossover junction endodeoxyribonuclease RuvC